MIKSIYIFIAILFSFTFGCKYWTQYKMKDQKAGVIVKIDRIRKACKIIKEKTLKSKTIGKVNVEERITWSLAYRYMDSYKFNTAVIDFSRCEKLNYDENPVPNIGYFENRLVRAFERDNYSDLNIEKLERALKALGKIKYLVVVKPIKVKKPNIKLEKKAEKEGGMDNYYYKYGVFIGQVYLFQFPSLKYLGESTVNAITDKEIDVEEKYSKIKYSEYVRKERPLPGDRDPFELVEWEVEIDEGTFTERFIRAANSNFSMRITQSIHQATGIAY